MSGPYLAYARHAALALAALALSAVVAVAFGAWLDQAPAMFQVLVEQGLALCF